MTEFLNQFGIEWHILLAQAVNFGILLFVLTKFVYRPVIRFLDARRKMIVEDHQKHRGLEEKLSAIERVKKEILREARIRSEEILKEAKRGTSALLDEARQEAAEEIGKLKADAKRAIEAEREKLHEEFRREAGELVTQALERAFGNLATRELKERLTDEALRIMRETPQRPARR